MTITITEAFDQACQEAGLTVEEATALITNDDMPTRTRNVINTRTWELLRRANAADAAAEA